MNNKEYYKNYYQENKEKLKIRRLLYYKNNKKQTLMVSKKYNNDNKEELKIKKQQYYQDNKEKILKKTTEHYNNNKESIKNKSIIYRKTHKKQLAMQQKRWREENKQYLREKQKNKYHSNIEYKIKHLQRTRIGLALKTNSKYGKTIQLLGCSIEFLKKHLQSQFKKGMNWDNHGKGGWEIDHKKPCDSFDLIKESEQRKCFHYTNLQPLWRNENLTKGAKWN